MSVNKDYELMKQSFLESKDIINEIFTYLKAPDYYFVQHMTFDELVAALYRLLGMYKNIYGDNPPHLEYLVDTYDADATSEDILLNKIAYVKGQRIEGSIVSYPGHTYTPTTTDIIIPEHHYLEGDQTIKGDANLVPANIKPGTTIFNVTNPEENAYTENNIILDVENTSETIEEGWHKQGLVKIQLQEKTVMPSKDQKLITPSANHVLSQVIVEGDDDLISTNIRKDSTIFGVPGSIYVMNTQNGDALAKEIVDGKIAYVKGVEVIGTMPKYDIGNIILDEEHAEQRVEEGYHKNAVIRIQTQEKYAHPTTQEQIIEPDDNHVLSRVFVDGDEDLLPQNIKKDVIIFGVKGTLEEFNKYNIVYVMNVPKKAALQQQVECGIPFTILGTTPQLDDYEFKGWSTNPQATSATYQPNQSVSTDLAEKGGVCVLYAVTEELNLANITLNVTYQNNGRLSNGQEIATVTVNGGNLPSGYSGVQRDIQCDGAVFNSKFANETTTSYKNQLKFTEIGFYPVVVVHTKGNKQVSATEVIKVEGENGGMSGEGTMTFETDPQVSYFDSGWVSSNIIKGCRVKSYTYRYKSGESHSSQDDELAVFGKTTSGKTILLYDFGQTENIGKQVTLNNNISGSDIYNDGTYTLSLGSFTLNNGNLSTTQWTITDTFTNNDDIRQLRFFASSDHGQSCFSSAQIDYDIQYEFDMNLWQQER